MGLDSQHIYVEFHERAGTIFSEVLKEFEDAIKKVSRRTEEYKFVQLKEKYVNTLKHKLEDAANILLQHHQHHKQLHEMQLTLQQIIKDYLHRFVMKSRTM